MSEARLHLGDALEVMHTLDASSVHLIAVDPPYHRVKMSEEWDRQWKTDGDYLAWIGELCVEWHRILKPNGSLYVFASPRMAARVECVIGESFEVLNSIVWVKPKDSTSVGRYDETTFRQYYPNTERIIFAEQFGADSHAKGEAGYEAKCDELRGFVFASLLKYMRGEFEGSRLSRREVDAHFATSNVSQYWLQERGFIIPTADKWAGLRSLRPDHFRREYEGFRREYEDFRREYEDLCREYEHFRRPFSVDASVPYTDVWDFPTVPARSGKHPCQKPLPLLEHIVRASSRPGDVVLDCFMGSGTTGEACVNLGRAFVGVERDPKWFAAAERRIRKGSDAFALFAG